MVLTSKPELLILSGLPASGKSTVAKAWVMEDPDCRIRINFDDMRLEWYGKDWKWNRAEEDAIQAAARKTVEAAFKAGLSVVIDNTNLSSKVRDRWTELGKQHGVDVVEQEIDTSLQECIMRDGMRTEGRVGRAVIERMALFHGFIDWSSECGCPQKDFKDGYHHRGCRALNSKIIIVDIDGTVANCQHRIHHLTKQVHHEVGCMNLGRPFDGMNETAGKCVRCGKKARKNWAGFFADISKDEVIKPIADLVKILSATHSIVFISGRDTSVGIATEDWLDDNGFYYDHLFLRQSGDHRPTHEYKSEILEFIPKERIALVLDDRDNDVKMYREAGLMCLQVAPGAF